MDDPGQPVILLVEDEVLIAMATKLTLERNGYRVITVGDGKLAVEAVAARDDFALVLMDIDLGPGLLGTEAAQRILAMRELPLIFLSSHTEPEIVAQTEGITSYGYVVKNSGETVLIAAIRMAFRLFAARRLVDETFSHSINGLAVFRAIRNGHAEMTDCEFVRVNVAFETHTGLPTRAVIGHTLRNLYPTTQGEELIRLFSDVLERRASPRHEVYFQANASWLELGVFTTHGDQFTVVVNDITARKQAEERIARHNRELIEINRIGVLAKGELDTDRVLTFILEQMATALNASAGTVFLYDRERDCLYCAAALGLSAEFAEEYRRFPTRMGEGFSGLIAQTREALFVPSNCSADPRVGRAVMRQEGMESFIGVPILAADQLIGVINVMTRPPQRLSAEDVQFCAAIGVQAGWAILNAKLREEQTRGQNGRQGGERADCDQRFRTLADMALFGNAMADPAGTVTYVNRYFAQVHGYQPEELVGRNLSVFHTPAQMAEVNRVNAEMMRIGSFPPQELWHVRRDGTTFPMLMSAVLVRTDDGQPQHIVATAVEITEQKRTATLAREATAQLEEAHRRLSTIMSAAPVAILLFDHEARVIDDNQAARDIFGSVAVGEQFCGDYVHCCHCIGTRGVCGSNPECAECQFSHAIRAVLSGGSVPPEQDREVVQANGRRIWVRFTVVPTFLKDERCALLVAQDITARKRAETEIAHQLATKELLLKEVNHRIKNNIAYIEGLLTLQAGALCNEEAQRALLEAAARVRTMGGLYEKLVLTGEHTNVSSRHYIEDLISSMAGVSSHDRAIVVQTHIDDFLLDTRQAVALGLILNELVTNAFKYAFPGRRNGVLAIAVRCTEQTAGVTVEDNGVGMNATDHSPSGGVRGLGLTLVQSLVEQLRGTIQAETGWHEGAGTRIMVSFPLLRTEGVTR